MIPFPIFLGRNITEGQISRVKPPPEAFTEANYGESGSELLTAQLASKRAIILLGIDWHSSANRALLWGLGAAEARFWVQPRRVICPGGVEVVRRMASRKPREDPMTTKRKTATRSRPVKASQRKSSKRPVPVDAASGALAKMRSGTKNAQVVTMLRDQPGTTIAAIMAATGWQQHSVRGFLAAVVRKKLGLNLVSEPGEGGRVYRIIDDMASPAKADRVKQAA